MRRQLCRAILKMGPGVHNNSKWLLDHVNAARFEEFCLATAVYPSFVRHAEWQHPERTVAQPGWSILFVVDTNGAPSVAKWAHLFVRQDHGERFPARSPVYRVRIAMEELLQLAVDDRRCIISDKRAVNHLGVRIPLHCQWDRTQHQWMSHLPCVACGSR